MTSTDTAVESNPSSILTQLYSHLYKKAEQVEGVGFIPSKNLNDEIFVSNNNVAIPTSLLKPLFKYCYLEYNSWRSRSKLVNDSLDNEKVAIASVGLLVVRGDLPMVYNTRKQLISTGYIDTTKEIMFLRVLFSLHPKSASGWEHRRWCLQRLLDNEKQLKAANKTSPSTFSQICLKEEVSICARAASDYPKNYYAWTQRLWLLRCLVPMMMNRIPSTEDKVFSKQTIDNDHQNSGTTVTTTSTSTSVPDTIESIDLLSVLQSELIFTESWLRAHTSDHCAVNHRHQVYQQLLAPTKNTSYMKPVNTVSVLLHMFQSNLHMITSRPGYESLWLGRRMAVHTLLRHLFSTHTNTETGGQTISAFSPMGPSQDILLFEEEYTCLIGRLSALSNMELISLWLADFVRAEVETCRYLTGVSPVSVPVALTQTLLKSDLLSASDLDPSKLSSGGIVSWNTEKQLMLCRRYLSHMCFQVISFLSRFPPQDLSVSTLLANCKELYHVLCSDATSAGMYNNHMIYHDS